MTLISPSEHDLLLLWVQLPLLLLVARSLGALMKRFGQAAVVGELAAGLLLGPSVFGKLWPGGFEWIFPGDEVQSAMLLTVAWIGVVLLLVGTGYETDLDLLRNQGRAAAFVATGSLLVPLAFGLAIGFLLPDTFVGESGQGNVFALFIAAALSISSLPVIAKILTELGLLRRDFGQVTLAAGMANDVIGWLLLGVVAGIATSGEASFADVGVAVAGMVGLAVFGLTLGKRWLELGLRAAVRNDAGLGARFSIVAVFALSFGAFTQWLGVEAVLGAFVAGIVLGRISVPQHDVVEGLETVTAGLFAPIFFATAGLRVDLGALGDPEVALWAVAIVAIAALSKLLGAGVGAVAAGLGRQEALALGAGLNARGALEIVIATVGLGLGVLNDASYTIIVIMAMATSMMAPPMLRAAVSSWKGSEAEQARLKREEIYGNNLVVRADRLLLPTRGTTSSIVAAQLIQHAWPLEAPVTLRSVGSDEPDVGVLRDVLHDRAVGHDHVDDENPLKNLTVEAALGYGAIVVGTDDAGGEAPISAFVAGILRDSPIPVVVVRRGRTKQGLPDAFARAVVPVSGTAASRAAQEVAFGLGEHLGTEVVLAHVVSGDGTPEAPTAGGRSSAVARRLVGEAAEKGASTGARTVEVLAEGASTADEILEVVARCQADLLVIGANLRDLGEDSPFLGHNVEHLLRECPATVAVVAMPEGR